MAELLTIKLLSILIILVVTLFSGWLPFKKRFKSGEGIEFPLGEAIAAGVFLGAGLMHMLGDAANDFSESHINYPLPFLLAGIVFLALLWLEHIGRELYEHRGAQSPAFALLATLMLSIHSFLAGAALGLTDALSSTLIILFAIVAHKWAASFALAVHINRSNLSTQLRIICFIIFSCMTPLGILFGNITASLSHYPLIAPSFTALSAGTFLYLGTLHGLNRAVMIDKCCNLKHFSFVIIGFTIMAIVAIWT
ncbi:zinc transporter [Piscirickettsia salmonis]|uniref:ZIP zinc/iron transport family protein n=1 Tax=Piscirickettsia salmonis TaxID=1238 RepID=A0A9Q5VAZ4_PISSA|nr:ZIP family metal transporter [Piscirickettsia salmonis]RNC78630.1 zinc transporter [Piscirickettsiaceae bacterium NZ-RLO2]ALA24624.1 ZIP zinc transporter family protein [Piscirickettsia salmonis]APS44973.1 zinc transporter [Piscirickettsia salmonis]APS48333.1 zinc transporter [Piscirickettsia salmonis]APS49592.1 zinc transporter [Piscirickettsia salmonis]